MAPRILVTGATGFIGSHLARRLLQEHPLGPDAELVLVVRDPTRLSPALREGARLLVGDLRQADRFREEIAETTWCFHIAAEADYRGGSATVENNVESTRMLLDLLAEAPGLERFVFTSSIGAIDRRPNDPCRRPLTEDDPAHPLTPYGRSKWACEERIRRSPLPWSILRPTWVYGPGMRKTSHIRTFIRMVARRHPVTKFAFPGRVSLIHVTDLVDALLLLAKREEAVGQVYFAADGHPRSLGEIFREIGRYLGIRAGTIPFPRPFIRMMRALRPHLPFAAQNLFSDLLSASNEKLVRLGFTPQVPFAEGLLGTIHWDAREAMPPQERKWSLVTGAGSGIGKAVAQRLYAAGDRLLLVDCNGEALDREARRLEARAFPLDLARPDALETLLQTIEREGIELHRLVNAAGIGIRGTVAELGFEEQQRVIAVNVTALLFLSRFALRHFKAHGKGGTLVNIASSAAFQPLPFMAVYAASKAFVLSASEAIAAENPDICVVTVCPAGTDTGFQARAGVRRLPGERLLPPEAVAEAIWRAIRNNASTTRLVGANARRMALLSRLLPRRLSLGLWRKLMEKMR